MRHLIADPPINLIRLFALALLLLSGPQSASAHPAHVSIAEAEWNAQSKKLEVALRVHPHDLERALRARHGRHVVLDKTPKVEGLIREYLKSALVVETAGGKKAELDWIGKELEINSAWLYFEIALPAGPSGATFSNRVFLELLDDQVNTINFRVGDQRKSLSFSRQRSRRKLLLRKSRP